jgi:arylsulfatase A-like enzyme
MLLTNPLRPVFVAILVVVLTPGMAAQAGNDPVSPPNLVFILADDLGWADVGWHGSEIATPHLDALATSGVRLENHYVWPTCSPTRAAVLTGRSPSRFGILEPIADRSRLSIPPGTVTLASVLKTRGYRTALVGKWHLGLRPEVGPRQYGFESTYGYLHGQIDPYTHLYKNGDRTWHRNDQFIEETGHATDLLADEAVRWIEASSRVPRPFFLYLAFSVPHTPLAEPERWIQPYAGKIPELSRRNFAASVTHMDSAIGRVVEALERQGLRSKTLIVFSSDNGGQAGTDNNPNQSTNARTSIPPPKVDATPKALLYGGRYGRDRVLGNNRPLRGWKGEVFEGGIRVAAFANWPGTLAPQEVTAPISALDWLPTFARLAGESVDPKDRWEGMDVWPILAKSSTATDSRRILYWRTSRSAAIREGDWKLIMPDRKDGEPLLFNLVKDPLETSDLAQQQADRVVRLGEILRAQRSLDAQIAP